VRRAAKVDANQAAIVQGIREQIPCRVLSLAAVGKGVPDLLILFRDTLMFLEIKNRDGKGRVLTKAQQEFHEQWPVIVAESVEEAVREIVRRGE
jgi:hypothetical protein